MNFDSVKWGRSYQLWCHTTDTFAILVVNAQIWDSRTLPSVIICGSSMQQYPFPRLESSESMFSFRPSRLWLVTWHATCFAIIDLALPIAALHHGKTARSGEGVCRITCTHFSTKPSSTHSAKKSSEVSIGCSSRSKGVYVSAGTINA